MEVVLLGEARFVGLVIYAMEVLNDFLEKEIERAEHAYRDLGVGGAAVSDAT